MSERERIRNLKADFDLTMGLPGCPTIEEIRRAHGVSRRWTT